MAMKAHTKRWLFAVGVAGSLLAILFYLDRSAPAAQFTHVVSIGQRVVAHSAPASAADIAAPAPRPVADPVRERYIVQAGSSGEAASAVLPAGGLVTGDLADAFMALLRTPDAVALPRAAAGKRGAGA